VRDAFVIEIKELSFGYPGGTPVLDRVSLTIQSGEHVGLVGPNGSGKSTLIRHFNALLTPQSGTVLVDGLDVRVAKHRAALRQRVGLVFQNPENQIVGTIVEDDVAFGPENLGLPTPEIRARVEEALGRVGLSKLATRSPSTLSGGQKQRLAIGSVLAMLPAHLLLDEPLTMLDPQGRAEVLEVVTHLNRDAGISVVWVTHALDELLACSRIVALERGRIIFDGATAAFLEDAELHRRLQMRVPPVVRMGAELKRAGLIARDGALPRELAGLVEALGAP
jgi:energy-coupling factor transport system ATP-binding protein